MKSIADLYDLTITRLMTLDRMGEKSATKIIEAIESSKTKPWSRVLYGLGIRQLAIMGRILSLRNLHQSID